MGLARSALTLDFLIYSFGAWTVGYWIALAFGLGWYFALGICLAGGGILIYFARYWRAPQFDTSMERADTIPLAVILAVIFVWPIALEVGRSTLAVVALLLFALRLLLPVISRRFGRLDARVLAFGSIATLTTLAFLLSWSAFVAVLCVLAVGTILHPQWSNWFSEPAEESAGAPFAADGRLTRYAGLEARDVSTTILGVLGLLIGVWFVGISFWNADNTYYINKATHYAASPTSFVVRDYLYGIDGAQHYPFGDILSAFEPLVGLASAISGVSVSRFLFQLVVPASMVLVPFAARYAARGVGLRRANLVGGFAAASVLLMTATNTSSLFGSASLGKTIGRLVVIPLVIGATGMLLRRKDATSATKATLASICAVGCSPSLALAAMVIVAPFTAAGLWDLWPTRSEGIRSRLPSLVWISLPLGFLSVYSLVAQRLQESAGTSQLLFGFRFDAPQRAWEWATTGRDSSDHVLNLVFLLGSIALFPLLLGSDRLRRAGGLLILLLFGVLFAPWSFDPIVNRALDLSYFAWRFPWALPAGLLIGIALANVDGRRALGLLTVVAATMGLGLSGPDRSASFFVPNIDVRHAPHVWPWEAGIPADLRQTAESVAEATPKGGRFLAPPSIEEVTTAIQIDRFPVYARVVYAEAVGNADATPAAFLTEDRVLLGQGMTGTSPVVEAGRWRQALARLEVATVCVDKQTADGLRQVVMQAYVPLGSAGLCELWTRTPT